MANAGDASSKDLRTLFAARTRSMAPLSTAGVTTRIAVTGGSGFLGTNLIDFYLAHGAMHLVNWDVSPPRNQAQTEYWRHLDLCDEGTVKMEMELFRPDVIFHLGARTDLLGRNASEYAANIDGVRNLIQAVNDMPKPPRVVFASSRLVCRVGYQPLSEQDYCPSTPYGESKMRGELLVRELAGPGSEWLIVRPTSIWGPWFQTPYRDFFDAVSRGRYVHPANRRIHKSFGFVGNTAFQLDRLMFGDFSLARHQTIYLADYPPLELHEWASEMARLMGKSGVRSVPIFFLRSAGLIGDFLSLAGVRSAPLTSFRLNNLLSDMVHETGPLEDIAGTLPFTLSEGTEITVDWFRRFSNISCDVAV